MEHPKVVDQKNLPARLSIWPTLVIILAMDHWHARQWVWGAVLAITVVLWIAAIVSMCLQQSTKIWPDE